MQATLSHYRILEQIGAGGMGVVYRAHDERLDRDVALKVLPAGALADESARKRFHKEALALSKLSHPNIAVVHDFDTQEGTDFLVEELIPGLSLGEMLLSGPLPEREIINLGSQLAEGLAAAHEQGIIHRDLKPSNIRVTPDARLKVLDFGLAKLMPGRDARQGVSEQLTASLTEAQTVSGTLPYMAPEQLLNEKLDARTDLWATGCVLYEMATGRRPFLGSGPALTDAILHQPPAPPSKLNPKVNPGLESIILKCLEKDPALRYQHASDMGTDLQRLKRDTESGHIVVFREGAAFPRWLAGPKTLVAVAIILLALAAGYVGFRRYGARPATAAGIVAGKPSIAVLPLQNLSGDPANDYFSDGMTEEVSTKLSHIQDLKVASYSSVARFKGAQKTSEEIGGELQVRYLLEGRVRKSGNQVRVNVQLIDVATGFQVWADDFTGELKDVFALQEQTALKIAGALNLKLSPEEQRAVVRRYTENPRAYDAYLRGRALLEYLGRPEKLEAARRDFEQALEADPNYAPALAGLSRVDTNYYRDIDSDPSRLQRAKQFSQRALSLDPQLADAHVALGNVFGVGYEYRRATEEYRKAIQLEPENAQAWDLLSWALGYQEPPDVLQAEKAARESIRLGNASSSSYYHLGRALTLQGRYQEAMTAFDHVRELSPTSPLVDLGLGQVYLAQGDHDRAVAVLSKASRSRSAVLFFWLSSAYAARGDRDKALAALQQAFNAGYRDFSALDASPYFSSLRSDLRFHQMVQQYRK